MLEIVAGIVIGPSVLGWVTIDLPLQVLSLIGLVFLLFLAGLEIDFAHLRGSALNSAVLDSRCPSRSRRPSLPALPPRG